MWGMKTDLLLLLNAIEGLKLLIAAIDKAGYTSKIQIAMNVAASELYEEESAIGQQDWSEWSKFHSQVSIQLIGDDLTVTNKKLIKKALEKKAHNCLLLKVNQIGSVT